MTLSSAVDAPSLVNVTKTSPVKPIGTVHFPACTGANRTACAPVAKAQKVDPSAVVLVWSERVRREPPVVVCALLMTNEGNAWMLRFASGGHAVMNWAARVKIWRGPMATSNACGTGASPPTAGNYMLASGSP